MLAAIDFETFYSDDYGLRTMSAFRYCADPRFDAYCVSFAREDGVRFAGHPTEFNWDLVRGCDLFMHNATFDGLVWRRLQKDGKAPALSARIYDTADMVAYLGSMRNLQAAAKNFLGATLSKDVRDKMKGVHWDQIKGTPLGTELLTYAQQDADTTLALGTLLLPRWPEVEREVSRIGREKGWRGMPVDVEYLGYCKKHLDTLVHEHLCSIPWYPDAKPLSVASMREEARKCGIGFPASLDKRDAEAEKWFTEHSEKYPWVRAIRDYRRTNTLLGRINSLWDNQVNGWVPFELLYFGAGTTGRWSGGGVVLRRRGAKGTEEGKGKFNWQNMPRDAQCGVDLRYCAMAPEGQTFYCPDYSQIECRLLLWRAGDTRMLDLIRNGVHPYKAYAIAHLGATESLDKKDPLYLTAKACVLGCGYQAGGTAFQRAAKALAGLDITLERSTELVKGYRAANPLIVEFWKKHQMYLNLSANKSDPTHEVELASGRVLTYFNPRHAGENQWGLPQVEVQYTMGDVPDKIYGGLLTENEIQATARDVLRDGWVALDKAGIDVALTVHDEYVILGPDHDHADFEHEVNAILKKSSPWAEGCPLDVGMVRTNHYEK